MPITIPRAIRLAEVYEDLVDNAEDLVGAASRIAPAAAQEVLCSIGGALSLGAGPGGVLARISPAAKAQSDLGGILEAACPLPPPLPGPAPPPFTGGQCPGVLYVVSTSQIRLTSEGGPPIFNGSPLLRSNTVVGPVAGIEFERGQGQDVFIRHGEPSQLTLVFNNSSSTWLDGAEITGVVRQDGLPDDCGDPPPPGGPGTGPRPPIVQPPRSPDIPRVDPDGNPLPPIFFEPRVGPIHIGPGGDINIPVTVNVGGPSFNVPISIPVSVGLPDFAPTIVFGGSGGGLTPGQPTEPGPPQGICCPPPPRFVRPGVEEDPNDPPAEDDPNGVIVGVYVTTVEASDVASATIIGTAQPPLRVPRIATVQFGVGTEESEFIGPDTQVKQLRQYVAAPADVPITRAFVRWEPGFEGEFEYVYAPRNDPSPEAEPAPEE